ncbi:MAG: HAMP domain-containing sensor histidine kinase [Corynebacterium sp.]|uniref:sensor histidine kinase n=1 Tax=Corynebacterium sp. TaxID=1720 RepID=UPI0026E0E31A|nr:HAMP domain-containing sensor histidine kinase [Corynebacterium sp.]MDO5669638.1 HAMP domain-containing sensor histidine kinase [Corynebacterium sp.]
MILRRRSSAAADIPAAEQRPVTVTVSPENSWAQRTPLRWRLAVLTFAVVSFAIGLMTFLAYLTVSRALTSGVDRNLDRLANALLEKTIDPFYLTNIDREIRQFKSYNPDTRVSVSPPGWSFSRGDVIPVGGDLRATELETMFRTVGGERILSKSDATGATVVLAQDMSGTHDLITTLGMVLLAIAGLGTLLAIVSGLVVAAAGLKPLQRLQRAVDYVARTDDLRPIEVHGNDELAQMTRSFNAMLEALQESRTRQSQLVADAGHELKTPLTSMRTNIELLMMLHQPGAGDRISAEDRQDLERDVLAQMTELSTLIGDLVDLAREDATEPAVEVVDLDVVLATSLERVRRRRADIDFDLRTFGWELSGDQFSLGRATLNLLDNAAKWSPSGGVVRVRMQQLADDRVRLSIADSGPGVPVEDRERVFERFYRSPESRSQPGSGLGLAIVKQTIQRHGGRAWVEESSDGGARVVVELPGRPQVKASR